MNRIENQEKFFTAIKYKNIQEAKEVLKLVDINNIFNKDRLTPLCLAVKMDSLMMVNFLLDNGADINNVTKGYGTPLCLATEMGSPRMIKFLLEKGANINQEKSNQQTPLLMAIVESKRGDKGNINIARLLIKNGANVNQENQSGNTPLIFALWMRNSDMINLLLDNGADINYKNNNGRTPLFYATSQIGDIEMVKFLLNHGATINGNIIDASKVEEVTNYLKNWPTTSWIAVLEKLGVHNQLGIDSTFDFKEFYGKPNGGKRKTIRKRRKPKTNKRRKSNKKRFKK